MPDREEQLYGNLADWFNELDRTFLYLNTQRDFFWRVQEIIRHNPTLTAEGNHFFEFMKGWYESHIVLAIRRLADPHRATRSYLKFLEKVQRNHHVITRERYKQTFVGNFYTEDKADRAFDSLAGNGKDCLKQEDVEKDKQLLIAKSRIIMDYVNGRAAHFNPNQPAPDLNHTHVDEALQTISDIHKKYHLIFKGSGLATTSPRILYDWEAIFRIPWIMPESK